jgi:hypothetical protein
VVRAGRTRRGLRDPDQPAAGRRHRRRLAGGGAVLGPGLLAGPSRTGS